ncbi:MAG: hypothetical protein NXI10_11955 [bacterium]|nr:hypothetical protein [bacterium]
MRETRANYKSVELYAGGEILLPPKWYIDKMRKSGELEQRPDFINDFIEVGRVIEGFIAGVGTGFVDAAVGAVEDLYDLIMSIFTGEIFSQIADMFGTLWDMGWEGIWEAIKDFGTSTMQEVKDAWNNENPYQQGKYFGEIFGAILFEVVLAILTAGVGSVIRNSARVSKIMNLILNLKKIKAPDNVMDHADDIKKLNNKRNGPDIDATDTRKLDTDKKKTDPDKDKAHNSDNDTDKDKEKSDEEKNKENATELAVLKPCTKENIELQIERVSNTQKGFSCLRNREAMSELLGANFMGSDLEGTNLSSAD